MMVTEIEKPCGEHEGECIASQMPAIRDLGQLAMMLRDRNGARHAVEHEIGADHREHRGVAPALASGDPGVRISRASAPP